MRFFSNRGLCRLLFLALLILFISNSGYAQGEMTRKFGLTGSLQGGQATILVPLWLGDVLVLAPGVSLNYVESTTTNLTLLVAPRFYLQMNRISPYISGRLGVRLNMPNVGGDTNDVLVGIGLGGEYFINPKFSFGVEAQLNGMIIDISGASVMTITTGTAVNANVYF